MKKYLIKWNAGYGDTTIVAECASQGEAESLAYQEWKNEGESDADYSAEVLNEDNAAEYGHEDELENN